jgi:hypothetical protein
MKYPTLLTIHLLSGAFALPALLMYAVSAVQMAHNQWFVMKPAVWEAEESIRPGYADGRLMTRDVMARRGISGEINAISATPSGFTARVVVPGTVHEIRYDRATGRTTVRTSVAGFMGMLNRLHHAAGLWPEYAPLRFWGLLVGLVSLATLLLGATGIWMWWLRRTERKLGLALIAANLAFSLTVLWLMRSTGP